jgi:hypothetical protein
MSGSSHLSRTISGISRAKTQVGSSGLDFGDDSIVGGACNGIVCLIDEDGRQKFLTGCQKWVEIGRSYRPGCRYHDWRSYFSMPLHRQASAESRRM